MNVDTRKAIFQGSQNFSQAIQSARGGKSQQGAPPRININPTSPNAEASADHSYSDSSHSQQETKSEEERRMQKIKSLQQSTRFSLTRVQS